VKDSDIDILIRVRGGEALLRLHIWISSFYLKILFGRSVDLVRPGHLKTGSCTPQSSGASVCPGNIISISGTFLRRSRGFMCDSRKPWGAPLSLTPDTK
jgi:hypothetical protein